MELRASEEKVNGRVMKSIRFGRLRLEVPVARVTIPACDTWPFLPHLVRDVESFFFRAAAERENPII